MSEKYDYHTGTLDAAAAWAQMHADPVDCDYEPGDDRRYIGEDEWDEIPEPVEEDYDGPLPISFEEGE